jgi:UDP-2-acetamido-3-amino-2,3-dideoxy-glucuronate N-acetyltransferase
LAEASVFVHPTAEVADPDVIGPGTHIWHQAQVMPDATIGAECTLGKGVFVGCGSRIGDRVKIGNGANLFGPTVEDEAFIGPLACTLEDRHPRATSPDGARKTAADFTRAPALIRRGASIGAAAIILPGVVVGRFAMVSAGAIVHKDVPDYAIMAGNPARQVGYACRCGLTLDDDLACTCGRTYRRTPTGIEPDAAP